LLALLAARTETPRTRALGRAAASGPVYPRLLVNVSAMNDKINLAAKLALLDKPYEPGIVGFLNDYKLQVVKVKGPFVWHKHDETDDFFLVLSGWLTIHLRDRDIELAPGEIFIVPRGVEHCPDAQEDSEVLLIEPRDTVNTGDAGGPMTAEPRLL
jgi:mannose-6-phosphate isomerase-like protein (cupin superfamily)